MKMLKKGMLIAFLLRAAITVMAQEAPRSYYVRANGDDQNNNGRSETTPFKTIKRAIEVASQGAIKRITIIGTLNQASEGGNSGDGVFVLAYRGKEELIITGMSGVSQQQKAILSASGTKKRVVGITGSGPIKLENIEISGANITGPGAGVYNGGDQLTIGFGTRIANNVTTDNGGGVYASETTIIEEGVEITQNSSKHGGGIYVPYSWNKLTITGGNFNSNKASGCGGGIYVEDAYNTFKMENGIISKNSAGVNGGGLYIAEHQNSPSLANVKIENNSAKNKGGGIYLGWDAGVGSSSADGGSLEISTCEISNNKAEFGAGIYFHVGRLTLNNGSITNNNADFVGGGIYVANVEGETTAFAPNNCEIAENQAGDGGEDIFKQD